VVPGSTVIVDAPAEEADSDDVRLTVIEPAPKPTPVGVGAEGGPSEGEEEHDGQGPGDSADVPSEAE
jgi:hypothetical protein